jgi:predicted TPR repeat methyltransferase
MAIFDTKSYWDTRYSQGGNSGLGSQTVIRQYKLERLNNYVAKYNIRSILDLGCGDGRQLSGLVVPKYTGVDVSSAALAACRARYASKPGWQFLKYDELTDAKVDTTMSLDVIYHLVNDDEYFAYIKLLADRATRYIIVFSTTRELRAAVPHIKHRNYLQDILADKGLSIVSEDDTPAGLETSAKFVVIKRECL